MVRHPDVTDVGGSAGVLVVETIGRVRRDHAVQGKGIKQIARERGLSRNTVRKILRQGETASSYRRERQPVLKLGDHAAALEKLLLANEGKGRREKLTLMRMFALLRDGGYVGGYDAVRRHARRWQQGAKARAGGQVFIPLWFAPGDAYQFDWSQEVVVLGGATTTVKVAHVRLCHSRMFLVVAYLRETQEMLFDAHERAFGFFGGACCRGIYDNMSTAADAVFVGKKRIFNRRFEQMCSHHLVEPIACTPASGWEKGQVENQVGNLREWLFTPRLRFGTLVELNEWLLEQCLYKAAAQLHPEFTERSVAEVFAEEKAKLMAYRGPFDGYREVQLRASKSCLVSFDRNRYSVASKAANQAVSLRAYAARIVVRLDGEVVAEHARVFGRDRIAYDPWHYVPVLERKPGALRNGAPFRDWALPPLLAEVRRRLGRDDTADRQFVELLTAAAEFGLEAVEAACGEAVAGGACSSAIVLNHLARQHRPPPPEVLPTAPTLRLPPVADCARYDTLRGEQRHGEA
jgi:transposase